MKKIFLSIIIFWSLAVLTQAQNGSPYWSLAGNNNASTSSKLGTTNNIPLMLYTLDKERVRIGTDGRVSIGTPTLTSLLSLANSGSTATVDFRKTIIGPNISWIHFGTRGDWYIRSAANNGNIILQDQSADGRVGIGTTSPLRKLELRNGDFRIRTTNVPRFIEFIDDAQGHADYRIEHSQPAGDEFNRTFLTVKSSNDNFSTTPTTLATFAAPGLGGHAFIVNGKVAATGYDIISDARLKKDVDNFDSALDIVKKLQPKTYLFKREEYGTLNLPKEKQYGFLAQDLEKVLPELVTTSQEQVKINTNGKRGELKTVNYMELIPILTQAMQEQQQIIQELQQSKKEQDTKIEELKQLVLKLSKNTNTTGSVKFSETFLSKSTPNPANNTARISYRVPANSTKAELVISNNAGQQIRHIPLNDSGQIDINTTDLSNGIYFYALYLDGILMDAEKMMVSK